jgi:hypothetical protein
MNRRAGSASEYVIEKKCGGCPGRRGREALQIGFRDFYAAASGSRLDLGQVGGAPIANIARGLLPAVVFYRSDQCRPSDRTVWSSRFLDWIASSVGRRSGQIK